jgi:hypothetical protein
MFHIWLSALLIYLSFFIVQVYAFRNFQKPNPNTEYTGKFFKVAFLCSLAFLFFNLRKDHVIYESFAQWLVFSFSLFTFHIPWFSNLMGLVTRSISVRYLLELSRRGGAIRLHRLDAEDSTYSDFESITKDRIRWMLHFKILKKTDINSLEIGSVGYVLDFCRKYFLGLWKMEQLGK